MSELEITKTPPKQNGHVNGVGSRDLPSTFATAGLVEGKKKEIPHLSLPAGSVVSMQVESRIPGGREVTFLGFVVLTDELKVVPKSPKKTASSGAEMVTVVPDSDARQKEVDAFELAGTNHDYAALEGSWRAIHREDARLAKALLDRREDLVREHGLDKDGVVKLEITAFVK